MIKSPGFQATALTSPCPLASALDQTAPFAEPFVRPYPSCVEQHFSETWKRFYFAFAQVVPGCFPCPGLSSPSALLHLPYLLDVPVLSSSSPVPSCPSATHQTLC